MSALRAFLLGPHFPRIRPHLLFLFFSKDLDLSLVSECCPVSGTEG